MEKLIIKSDVGESRAFDAGHNHEYHTDINELIVWLLDAKNKGASHVEWTAKTDYDGCSEEVEAQPCAVRYETDKELSDRKLKEDFEEIARKLKAFNREQADYERLKKKFG